jgi:hypothetical protein
MNKLVVSTCYTIINGLSKNCNLVFFKGTDEGAHVHYEYWEGNKQKKIIG